MTTYPRGLFHALDTLLLPGITEALLHFDDQGQCPYQNSGPFCLLVSDTRNPRSPVTVKTGRSTGSYGKSVLFLNRIYYNPAEARVAGTGSTKSPSESVMSRRGTGGGGCSAVSTSWFLYPCVPSPRDLAP